MAETVQPKRPPLWLLAFITLSGTMAMHIFVPALPEAGRDLGAGLGAMQMTISLYILGLAFGQLAYGPLADALGRRPMLMAGLTIYALAGLAAALAPNAGALVVARLFQALGGCAGLVLGRAMVRDTAGPEETVRRLALLTLMMLVGPGLAPVLGGAMAATLGWRAIFLLLAAMGALGIALCWRLLPETGGRAGPVNPRLLGREYRALVGSRAFLGLAIGGGCATTSFYAFVAAAPFILTGELHRPPQEVGLCLGLIILGMAAGNLMTGRLAARFGTERLLLGANALSGAAALGFLGMVLAGRLGLVPMLGLMLVFTLGIGMASPAALARAVSVNPKVIGSASGLYGFAQMGVGALCTALAGLGRDPALAAAAVLAGASLVAQLAFRIALRRVPAK
ncbi:multidrug effflux MFS transporter [Belnapia sp. T18]|uniref:Bcr/CflA family efflux transporter n=1 Tax=Belnapia arida TaxID=2804533 RepID=A0ABS1U8V6_9PROT|nr:multidrug effflux MFS transporter [Belnapia arida]MBL6080955.1 multidrug effflux MFS transporter [Belnapia arida]